MGGCFSSGVLQLQMQQMLELQQQMLELQHQTLRAIQVCVYYVIERSGDGMVPFKFSSHSCRL